jgi:hypothetical protein
MRQAQPRKEDPSSELIRLTLLPVDYYNYRVEIPNFDMMLTLSSQMTVYINIQGSAFR